LLVYNVLGLDKRGETDPLFFLAGVNEARFKRMVVPGDQIELNVELIKRRLSLWKFQGTATVDGELACSATFMIAQEQEK